MLRKTELLGKWGEELAADFLQKNGLKVIAKNYRTPYGEIDLIFKEGESIIFIEVKTRRSVDFGLPEESMTVEKMEHLMDSIEYYLQNLPQPATAWRSDVITIIGSKDNNKPIIDWFKDVCLS